MPPSYCYRHVVTFDETNLVGNVYYTSHLHWQGRCRELFLRDHTPQIVQRLACDLALVTVECGVRYHHELAVFDEVEVRMRLVEIVQNRISLSFDYVRVSGGAELLVAIGHQQVATMARTRDGLRAVPIPDELRAALAPYTQALERGA